MRLSGFWNERPIIAGRWTPKDVLQGKPIRHPSHALFVHFPSALLPVAFFFALVTQVHADQVLAHLVFYNIAAGLTMAAGAVVTGLVDYLPMVGGSRKKKVATYHLLAQVPAMAAFALSLALQAGDFDAERTGLAALIFAGLGTAGIFVGNYFGGELVYRQGMRVSVDP